MLKKLIAWAVVVFIAFYLITEPARAASTVHDLKNGLDHAANSIATFIDSL
jgi:hypothetical protein